jgi:hypothetical protein
MVSRYNLRTDFKFCTVGVTCGKYWRIRELKRQKGIVKCNWELKKMIQIVGNLEWELLKNMEIRKSIYPRITNTRFVDPLFENFAYIKKKSHIFSLQTVTTFEPIIWSHWNSNLICILWYQTTVQNLKSVLKLYLETIGPSVRSSSPTYFTSTFISNSADGLVYPSTLSGKVLCDTIRLKKMVQIVGNLEWELLKNVEIRKSIYARITNTRFVDPLFENVAYIKRYRSTSTPPWDPPFNKLA